MRTSVFYHRRRSQIEVRTVLARSVRKNEGLFYHRRRSQIEVRTVLARSVRKNEGLVFHGTARVIRLINSLLNGENENIPKIH